MEHVFSVWRKLVAHFRSAEHILLFSDYDGTLTPIVNNPEEAVLPASTRALLQALARRNHYSVGIISGRMLADLKGRVNIDGIIYAGNHGLEIEAPGVEFSYARAVESRPLLSIIHRVLDKALNRVKGVTVEDKGLTLSVHYRMVNEDRHGEVAGIFERITGGLQASGKIRVTSGKKVLEVRPAVDWDKGRAVRLLMKRYLKGGGNSRVLPIYLGDDLSDEDAFRTVQRYGNGISIFVGEPPPASTAHYYLKSPSTVPVFLDMLLDPGIAPSRLSC